MYPSPVHGVLYIASPGGVSSVVASNVLGQCVAGTLPAPTAAGDVTKLDVSGLPAGVYIIRVADNNGKVVVRKVVKE